MAQLLDHVEYLSKEIGARPAGTEQEQEAALYIADQLQREAGFHAEIEEFTSSANIEAARAIPSVIVVLVGILSMLFNVLTLPALVLTLVAAALYALEAYDRPVLTRLLAQGPPSQNVVAKYQPYAASDENRRMRSRKFVVVAHYDTAKAKPALLRRIDSLGLPLGLACLGAMLVVALLTVVRIFVGGMGGVPVIVLNVLTIIALIVVALPILKAVLYLITEYNEGANNNATGAAALIELASRINQGSVSEAELAAAELEALVHGEGAALESGLVPDGVELSYETGAPAADGEKPQQDAPVAYDDYDAYDEFDEKDRLLAAKAAIAALTGRPVEQHVYLGETGEAPAEPQRQIEGVPAFAGEGAPALPDEAQATASDWAQPAPQQAPEASAPAAPAAMLASSLQTPAESVEVAGFQNAPSWFVAAQKNAKKTNAEPAQVQRSRFTSAIDEAEREMAERRQAERTAQQVPAASVEAQPAAPVAPGSPAETMQQPQQSAPALAPEPPVAPQADIQPRAEAPSVQEQEPEVDLGMTVAYKPLSLKEMGLDDSPEEKGTQPDLSSLPELAEPVQEEAPSKPVLTELPSIQAQPLDQALPAIEEPQNPSRSGMFRKLRADIPSLSGVIRMQNGEEEPVQEPAQNAAQPSAAELNRVVPPVTEPAAAPDDTPVDYDMEVSALEEVAPSEPASGSDPLQQFAPGEVEMPASRADGLLGRLRKKDENLVETPQEWLDVDKNFDARTVGRERGGWESFQNESGRKADGSKDWEGGAFSRVRLGHVDTRSVEDGDSDQGDEFASDEDRILNEEIGQIIHFRNPEFDTEVWFVAIGSDTAMHDGARAFINEHRSELRGAMIVEVESLGAGTLAVATEEGQYRRTRASSRVKRFARPASEATGIVLDEVKLTSSDSIASVAQKEGFQAMHLLGVENGEPALKGSMDDVFENVDEYTLEDNVAFLMELLKQG